MYFSWTNEEFIENLKFFHDIKWKYCMSKKYCPFVYCEYTMKRPFGHTVTNPKSIFHYFCFYSPNITKSNLQQTEIMETYCQTMHKW